MLVMVPDICDLYTLSALVLLIIIFPGCTATAPVQPVFPAVERTPAVRTPTAVVVTDMGSTKAIAEAYNQFAFNLYSRLAKDWEYTGRNIFFSPFSVSSALAITYEGASGKTADEIGSVFHFPENNTVLRSGLSGMIAASIPRIRAIHCARPMPCGLKNIHIPSRIRQYCRTLLWCKDYKP